MVAGYDLLVANTLVSLGILSDPIFCANYVAEYKPLKVDLESMRHQILESYFISFLVSQKIQM